MKTEDQTTETTEQTDEQPSTGFPTLDLSKTPENMTNVELRAKIALRLGHRPSRKSVTIPILNSLHAWFTGEYYVNPSHLNHGFRLKKELLAEVVWQAIDVYDHPTNPDPRDDYERGDHPADALLAYLENCRLCMKPDLPAMKNRELRQLVAAMNESDDQRNWAGEQTTISDPENPRETISGAVVRQTNDGTACVLQPTDAGEIQVHQVAGETFPDDMTPEDIKADNADPPTLTLEQFTRKIKGGDYYFPNGNTNEVMDAVRTLRS